MKLLIAATFAAVLVAPISTSAQQAPDPAVVKFALDACGPMPACKQLVKSGLVPPEFVAACEQAFDSSLGEAEKTGSSSMCNTLLGKILQELSSRRASAR